MSSISLRVPEKELELIRDYAKVRNESLSEVIRATMMEKIEEEYDLGIFEKYEQDKRAGTVKTYTHDEAWEKLGV